MNKIFFGLTLLLLGCGSRSWVEPINANTFGIGCKKHKTYCFQEAYEVCPNGFRIIDGSEYSENKTGGAIIGSTIILNSSNSRNTEFIIRCTNNAKLVD